MCESSGSWVSQSLAVVEDTMKIIQLYLAVLAVCKNEAGRTTNRFYSLANGGYHHHGGFLAGYHNFYRGNIDNPGDSFSNKYQTELWYQVPEDQTHHFHDLREPVFEEIDPRLLLEIPPNTNSSTFYLKKLLDLFDRK